MRLVSIGGGYATLFREAILGTGYAPDGTLWTIPNEEIPRFSSDDIEALRHKDRLERYWTIAQVLLGSEFAGEQLWNIVHDSFTMPAPVVHLEGPYYVQELCHGDTDAFKDFGARFQARTISVTIEILIEKEELDPKVEATGLGTTSGDTGPAAGKANHKVRKIKLIITYPRDGATPFQKYQMELGKNVFALELPTDFDHNMRLLQRALKDQALSHLRLFSINSINMARLVGQIFYYFDAYFAVTERKGQRVVFSVPCGNIGNITAGGFAQRMGLPIKRFVAAGNINTPLVRYAQTGVYEPLPKSVKTDSTAMDVADPVNWLRLIALHHNSHGEFVANVSPYMVTDEQARSTICGWHGRNDYLFDPHGAVGQASAELYVAQYGENHPVITLATARPAKFGTVIQNALGFTPEVPEKDRGWEKRPRCFHTLPAPTYEHYFEFILDVVSGRITNSAALVS